MYIKQFGHINLEQIEAVSNVEYDHGYNVNGDNKTLNCVLAKYKIYFKSGNDIHIVLRKDKIKDIDLYAESKELVMKYINMDEYNDFINKRGMIIDHIS